MISLRGVARTQTAFLRVRLKFEAASPLAARAGGGIIQRQMVAIAPRRTGQLAASISTDVASSGEGAIARTGSDVSYDRFVQHGTIYMEAQPYGEDASDDVTVAVVAAMAAVYRAAI